MVFVEPRWSETPGPGLIAPAEISDEDLFFIVRWATLGVGAEVSDPATFRGQPPVIGPGGGAVEVPPVRVAEGQ